MTGTSELREARVKSRNNRVFPRTLHAQKCKRGKKKVFT